MWLSNLLKAFSFEHEISTGVVEDTRAPEQKQCDYLHEERAARAPSSDPFGNMRIEASQYKIEYQNSTSSCVPHGVALALAIERELDTGVRYERLSPMFAYRLRATYPAEGSWLQNIFDINAKYGAPLWWTLPTPFTEREANAVVVTEQAYKEAEIFKGKEYYTLETPNDIEAIARIAQAGHGVPILIYAQYDEWAQQYPAIYVPTLKREQAVIRHCVTVLPRSGFMRNGRRHVAIQDSSPFGGISLRYLSEDFIAARCYGAGYWDTVSIISDAKPPVYTFTKVLKYGSSGAEVKALQQLLVSERVLPADCVTGYFGGRTLAGIRAFQNKYAADILIPINLDAPTNTWGARCIAKANALCSKTK